jgi:hypothetical protein
MTQAFPALQGLNKILYNETALNWPGNSRKGIAHADPAG